MVIGLGFSYSGSGPQGDALESPETLLPESTLDGSSVTPRPDPTAIFFRSLRRENDMLFSLSFRPKGRISLFIH
jgi:hypothetical protein